MRTFPKLFVLAIFAASAAHCVEEKAPGVTFIVGAPCELGGPGDVCSDDGTKVLTCDGDPAKWELEKDCEAMDRVCAGVVGYVDCVAEEECSGGQVRCSGDGTAVEECSSDGEWVVIETCEAGEACIEGDWAHGCVGSGDDTCTSDDFPQRCDPDNPAIIQECINGFWEEYLDCSLQAPTFECQSDGSFPYCIEPL